LNYSKGTATSPNKNMYELLSHGEHISTTKIVGIPLFNSRTSIITPIMEENLDFVPLPIMERNIP
jgi:hypothetical protein